MKKDIFKIIISACLLLIGIFVPFSNIWLQRIIFILSYLIVGFEVLKEAIENIFKGELFDENFLMAIATIGAFLIGNYPEAVSVMLFYQIGELFQDYAVDKSRASITSLMDIRPDYANVKRDGKILKVSPNEVKIGEIIVVKPGEKVPLDGIVIDGNSMLDTSAITGESVPRSVKIQDEILSGCINKNKVLNIKVTKEFSESTVSKILDLVENASNKKSKSENFITKFAKLYTPTVVVIALLLAIFPPIIFKSPFAVWLYRALTFLVVSCPCALVISIPLGFFGGIGSASKNGILVKGSNYLEALSNAKTICFDKTGTLTEGIFEVQKIEPIGIDKNELLKIATYSEHYSNHPISISLKNSYNGTINENSISDFEELSGFGIHVKIDGKDVLIGNEKLMLEKNISYTKVNEIGTILFVAIDGVYSGYIVIADKIKSDAKYTIDTLKANYIDKTIMLTGDLKNVGESVATELNIDTVYTELLPNDKAKKLEEIMTQKNEKEKIVFVGDGINDSPVLALADIGIAMGGAGSDSAIEAADIVIMTDEPSKIVKAIDISRKTLKIVKQNIFFAIFVKIAVLVLSAFGLSTMWEAVFADVGVSVIATINSIRALKK